MKKTIQIITCDLCNQEIKSTEEIVTLKIKEKLSEYYDYCIPCLTKLVKYGLKYCEKHVQKCQNCDGKGRIKLGYYHNCYDYEKCKECKGSGFVEV